MKKKLGKIDDCSRINHACPKPWSWVGGNSKGAETIVLLIQPREGMVSKGFLTHIVGHYAGLIIITE